MKKAIVLCMAVIFAACERFPSNPSKEVETEPSLSITAVQVQYLPLAKAVDGLIAKKMNVVKIGFRASGFQQRVQAVELCGSVWIQGPPDNQEHDLHIRTDMLDVETEQPGMGWNLIPSVAPDSIYTMVRCKLPMNEYAPFEGNQGKVLGVKIKQAWAVDSQGNKTPMKVAE
jgi:hypothetical protein